MKYMIDTKKLSQGRPSKEQMAKKRMEDKRNNSNGFNDAT